VRLHLDLFIVVRFAVDIEIGTFGSEMVHLKNQGGLSGDKWRIEFVHAPVDLVFNAERADGIFYRMGVALLNVTTLGLSSNIIIHHLLPAKPVAVGRATTIGLASFSASEMAAAIIHRILQGVVSHMAFIRTFSRSKTSRKNTEKRVDQCGSAV
jgi:hypothetical protein